jgi:hypothetical protein
MNNAMWLLTALPTWFLEAAADPFGSGALTLVPAVGLLALVVGVIAGVLRRRRELLWFLLLFAFSEALVAIAGGMRGQLRGSLLNAAMWAFLAAQAAASAYLVYRIRGARLSAVSLGFFSLTYACAASLIASMSFSDVWL